MPSCETIVLCFIYARHREYLLYRNLLSIHLVNSILKTCIAYSTSLTFSHPQILCNYITSIYTYKLSLNVNLFLMLIDEKKNNLMSFWKKVEILLYPHINTDSRKDKCLYSYNVMCTNICCPKLLIFTHNIPPLNLS